MKGLWGEKHRDRIKVKALFATGHLENKKENKNARKRKICDIAVIYYEKIQNIETEKATEKKKKSSNLPGLLRLATCSHPHHT